MTLWDFILYTAHIASCSVGFSFHWLTFLWSLDHNYGC